MSEMVKEWCSNLLKNEIKIEKGTVANEQTWADGSPTTEEASMHKANIDLHEEYIDVLEKMLAELDCD